MTLYQQQILKSMTIDTLHSQGLRFVESHICQNRADMGHPAFVAGRAVRNLGHPAPREMFFDRASQRERLSAKALYSTATARQSHHIAADALWRW